ncbi:MAG: hypothetical protein JSW54_06075 [Fidelibacterota bacterium]|nr:MAG: hypothetical protein JSW54_06075 [Candidatus Neomarinimicrobiota bacterium]
MKIQRDWSETDRETIAKVLRDALKDVAAAPNEVLVEMLYDKVEVSVYEDHEKFTAYKVEGEAIVWICAGCGQTNIFTSDDHYSAKGGVHYYQTHEPECG